MEAPDELRPILDEQPVAIDEETGSRSMLKRRHRDFLLVCIQHVLDTGHNAFSSDRITDLLRERGRVKASSASTLRRVFNQVFVPAGFMSVRAPQKGWAIDRRGWLFWMQHHDRRLRPWDRKGLDGLPANSEDWEEWGNKVAQRLEYPVLLAWMGWSLGPIQRFSIRATSESTVINVVVQQNRGISQRAVQMRNPLDRVQARRIEAFLNEVMLPRSLMGWKPNFSLGSAGLNVLAGQEVVAQTALRIWAAAEPKRSLQYHICKPSLLARHGQFQTGSALGEALSWFDDGESIGTLCEGLVQRSDLSVCWRRCGEQDLSLIFGPPQNAVLGLRAFRPLLGFFAPTCSYYDRVLGVLEEFCRTK